LRTKTQAPPGAFFFAFSRGCQTGVGVRKIR